MTLVNNLLLISRGTQRSCFDADAMKMAGQTVMTCYKTKFTYSYVSLRTWNTSVNIIDKNQRKIIRRNFFVSLVEEILSKKVESTWQTKGSQTPEKVVI